ncbi:hypothetical protein EPO34_00570 [Patescibacteria group bacterium]|nr:MAG: hypothetical protein EPO34_00570 [Patescibacteria group bacterium]
MSWLSAFLDARIDVQLYVLTVLFGWIGTAAVLAWGFVEMWKNHRQGLYVQGLQHVLLAINVPAMTEQSPKAVEALFSNLIGSFSNLIWKEKWLKGKVQPVFSFEIASTEGYIQFYVHTQTKYRDVIEANVYAHYPEAEIVEVEDYAASAPTKYPDEHYEAWGAEMTLSKEEFYPLRTYVDFEDKLAGEFRDPLGQMLESFGKMRPGEHLWMQVLISPGNNDWKDKGLAFIDETYGNVKSHKPGMIEAGMSAALSIPNAMLQEVFGGASEDAHAKKEVDPWKAFKITPVQKEIAEGILRKCGKVGFPSKVRLVYVARKEAFNKGSRAPILKGMLQPYSHLNMNSFRFHGSSVPKDDYFWQRWSLPKKQGRLVRAFRKRSWTIGATPKVLNAEELATIWHFPAIGVKAPLVRKSEAKRGEPPVDLPLDSEGALPKFVRRSEPEPDAHGDHGHGHVEAAPDATHALPGLPTIDVPAVSMPAMPISDAPPRRRPVQAEPEAEEREPGLDATDMGPPAGVVLPGPPPGWKEETRGDGPASSDAESPPNLPV